MVPAAFVNRLVLPLPPILRAKLVHDGSTRCIHCGFRPIRREDKGTALRVVITPMRNQRPQR